MAIEPKHAGSAALLAAAAAASTASHPAMAADFAAPPAPPPAPTWQGLYVGGSVGASWLNSVLDDSFASVFGGYYAGFVKPIGNGQRSTANALGWLGGMDVGYNWQDRKFVFGVEADISWVGNATATTNAQLADYTAYTTSKSSQISALSTFRARFGIDIDGTMPYLTAEVAVANVKDTYTVASPPGFPGLASTSITNWQPGLAAGGGIEHQFANHWTLRGEVLWVGFKDTTFTPNHFAGYPATPAGNVTFSNSLVLGKIGLNYRF